MMVCGISERQHFGGKRASSLIAVLNLLVGKNQSGECEVLILYERAETRHAVFVLAWERCKGFNPMVFQAGCTFTADVRFSNRSEETRRR
jgi:hypothetical protein